MGEEFFLVVIIQADVNQDNYEDEEEQVHEEMATCGFHALPRLLLSDLTELHLEPDRPAGQIAYISAWLLVVLNCQQERLVIIVALGGLDVLVHFLDKSIDN